MVEAWLRSSSLRFHRSVDGLPPVILTRIRKCRIGLQFQRGGREGYQHHQVVRLPARRLQSDEVVFDSGFGWSIRWARPSVLSWFRSGRSSPAGRATIVRLSTAPGGNGFAGRSQLVNAKNLRTSCLLSLSSEMEEVLEGGREEELEAVAT